MLKLELNITEFGMHAIYIFHNYTTIHIEVKIDFSQKYDHNASDLATQLTST